MGDGSLSQEEIDALLMGSGNENTMAKKKPTKKKSTSPGLTALLDAVDKTTPDPIFTREKPIEVARVMNAVPLKITVVLGETSISINDIKQLGEGSIVTLDKLAGEEVEIRANDVPIAMGEVLVIDEKFGIRITNNLTPEKQRELMLKGSKQHLVTIQHK